MEPDERRREIIVRLIHRKHDTMNNLALEFGVSVHTIQRDIDRLSLAYPLRTVRGRYGGGVCIAPDYKLDWIYLTTVQQNLLERLAESLTGTDRDVMQSILCTFALET